MTIYETIYLLHALHINNLITLIPLFIHLYWIARDSSMYSCGRIHTINTLYVAVLG
uniref:Uncharacterized protein n=1 Tax=Rhizophora mucronata TaxID=61149 RepID=A0A2P2J4B3_RHIMU